MKLQFSVDLYSHKVKFATSADELGVSTECEFACFYDDGIVAILCSDAKDDKRSVDWLRYLSHECNHAAMRMLENVGVNFDKDNQEVLCYLQDYIFSKILSKIFGDNLKGDL